MMKFNKKHCGMLILLLIVFGLFTGCSAGTSVDTILTLSEGFSGTREMDVYIDESYFEEYFSGTVDDMKSVISSACPSEITAEYVEDSMMWRMTIEFSSSEDYITKVSSVLGETPEVVMNAPDSIWASGLYVYESFTSTDLLQWMSDALVAGGYVTSDHADNIFSNGGSVVVYEGKEYSAGSQIEVDEIEYLSINSINVYTEATDCLC